MSCELTLGTAESASMDGMVATTMRVVNAVPYVVAAPPGIATALELPITAPHQPSTDAQRANWSSMIPSQTCAASMATFSLMNAC